MRRLSEKESPLFRDTPKVLGGTTHLMVFLVLGSSSAGAPLRVFILRNISRKGLYVTNVFCVTWCEMRAKVPPII